jgi:hypothetical protein
MLMVSAGLQLIYEDYSNMLIPRDVLVIVIISECLVNELVLIVFVFRVFILNLTIIIVNFFILF